MRYWLMKTEPDVFSWDDLMRQPVQTTPWEGVRNYQARNFMRDEFSVGDRVFFYHSSCEQPGIVGLCRVSRASYPDQSALDPVSPYADEKSIETGLSRWVVVDVTADRKFSRLISLDEIRRDPALQDMLLLRPGQRLSVQPVEVKHAHAILNLAGLA